MRADRQNAIDAINSSCDLLSENRRLDEKLNQTIIGIFRALDCPCQSIGRNELIDLAESARKWKSEFDRNKDVITQ